MVDAEEAGRVEELAFAYVDGRRPLFEQRVADGRARDGHGDLLAEDVFWLEDGPRILDCLDFDDRLRWDDVLADVCFLAMDLERLGRGDLSTVLLDEHRRLLGDDWPRSLAHHHIAYRAHVRAKVACIRHDQGDVAAGASARQHLGLARQHLEDGRVRAVLVGGLPGTGKSTIASTLAAELDAVHLRTDEIRKELAGIAPLAAAGASFGRGLYEAAAVDATYEELCRRAAGALAMGRSVVLDASWRDGGHRDRAVAGARAGLAELSQLRCSAPTGVAAARVRARAAARRDPSDATPEVAAAMAASFEAWPGAVTVDTSGPLAASLDAARRVLGLRPPTIPQGRIPQR